VPDEDSVRLLGLSPFCCCSPHGEATPAPSKGLDGSVDQHIAPGDNREAGVASEIARDFWECGVRLSIAMVWSELAVCYLGLGDDAGAMELFRSVLAREITDPPSIKKGTRNTNLAMRGSTCR
jgi:hypothetical protein